MFGALLRRPPVSRPAGWRDLEHALDELYAYYEQTAPMLANVLRDAELVEFARAAVAPLHAYLDEAADVLLDGRRGRLLTAADPPCARVLDLALAQLGQAIGRRQARHRARRTRRLTYHSGVASHPRSGFVLATAAVLWAAGFTGWALTASAYSDGQTILEANPETIVRVVIAFPLAASALVWVLLGGCRTNRSGCGSAGSWRRRCSCCSPMVAASRSACSSARAVVLVLAAVYTPVSPR